MATLKRLITFADVNERTTVARGGEAHKFTVAIPQAEQRHLRPVLGHTLYGELLNFIQQVTPDTADPLAALADQVKDMLAAWAVVVAWPSLLIHLEAVGVVVKVGEKTTGTTSADLELTDRSLASFTGNAQWQSSELIGWLTERAADYPSWQAPGGNPSSEMPLGGLFL